MTATNFSIAFELLDFLRLGREHAPRPRAIVTGNIGTVTFGNYYKTKRFPRHIKMLKQRENPEGSSGL